VDDSAQVCEGLMHLLECIPGVDAIDQAGTLAQALERARLQPPTLVILDICLPDGQGFDIIHKLKLQHPSPRIAMFSLKSDKCYRDKCSSLGADGFFDKATGIEDLLDEVRVQASIN